MTTAINPNQTNCVVEAARSFGTAISNGAKNVKDFAANFFSALWNHMATFGNWVKGHATNAYTAVRSYVVAHPTETKIGAAVVVGAALVAAVAARFCSKKADDSTKAVNASTVAGDASTVAGDASTVAQKASTVTDEAATAAQKAATAAQKAEAVSKDASTVAGDTSK